MKSTIYWLMFLLSLFSTGQLLSGEIYKWKDKNGKIHYSEKKPENTDSVESVDADHDKAFNPVKTSQGINNSQQNNQRHIVVVRPDNFWQLTNPQQRTTAYYFGGDCVSPISASFLEMQENHQSLLPRNNNVIDYVVDSIYRLNYSVSSSMKKPLYNNLARFEDPVVLRFRLENLVYHLCVENLRRQYRNHKKIQAGSNPFDFSISEFRKRRATVTLGWTLHDASSGKQLYQGTTAGSADYWDKDVIKFRLRVIKKAIENATSNLLSERNFIEQLLPSSNWGKSKKIAIPKRKDKGLLDSIGDIFASNAVRKTEFAKVIAATSPLKIMLTEYYMAQGSWPKSLTDIQVSRTELFAQNSVENVQIDYDGAIVLSLDSQKFGDDATVSLQPEVFLGGGRIDWQCITNLDESYHGRFCKSVE